MEPSSRKTPSKSYPEGNFSSDPESDDDCIQSTEDAEFQQQSSQPTLRLRSGGGGMAAHFGKDNSGSHTPLTDQHHDSNAARRSSYNKMTSHHEYDTEANQHIDQSFRPDSVSYGDSQPTKEAGRGQSSYRGRGRSHGIKRGLGRGSGSNRGFSAKSQASQNYQDSETVHSADNTQPRHQEFQGYVRGGKYNPNQYHTTGGYDTKHAHEHQRQNTRDRYWDSERDEFFDAQEYSADGRMGFPSDRNAYYDNQPFNPERGGRGSGHSQRQPPHKTNVHGNWNARDRDEQEFKHNNKRGTRGHVRAGHSNVARGRSIEKSSSSPTHDEYPATDSKRGVMDEHYSDTNVDIAPITLEVSGFKPSIDEDLLEMYFESPRKSDGGEMEEFKMSPSKRSATIIFKDVSVTQRVLNRSHSLEGAVLTVVEKKDIKEELMNEDLPNENKDDNIEDDAEQVERMIKVSGIKPSTEEEMLMMYFENTRKSGGGDIKDMQIDINKRLATITFIDDSVIDSVLKKSHRLNGATLTVVETKPRPPKPVEQVERMIEVSGIKPSTEEDMLMMYFENTRKSGGGDIKDMQIDINKRLATITFIDDSVIDSVLKKSHRLNGATLTVVETKPRPPRPVDSHRIFLTGVPEDIHQETFLLFIENRTSMPEDASVIYGEKPGTVMLYYSQEIPDLDSVVQKFSKKKLKGSYLTAESVKATDCILVQGLKPNTSKDVIELYFENSRKSGGDTVTDVKYYEEENKATVTFEDWTVVNKVSERDHVFLGERSTVTAHHECLGTAVSSDGPIPVIPKPIPYSVDIELIEHIMDKHQAKLVADMKQSKIEITWPHNGDRSQALLNPIPTKSADRDMWRKWTDTAANDFKTFIKTFLKESIPIPITIWSDLSDMIPQMETPNIAVHQIADKSIITLIGTSADVIATKAVLLGNVQDLKTKAEIEAQTIEKKHLLSPLRMTLFTTFDILNELNTQFPKVHITVLSGENAIGFKGMRGEISESQVALYGIFESLVSVHFEADPSIHQFIDRFCDTTNGILLSKGLTALCHTEDGQIHVYGRSSADTQAAMKCLNKDITCKQMPIDKDATMNALQTAKGNDKIDKLNNNEVVIKVDPSKRQIKIVGLTDKVEMAVAEIGTFLDENVIIEKLVFFPPLHVKYLLGNCGAELSDITKHGVTMQPKFNGNSSGLIISGKEKKADAAISLMEKLKSKIVDCQHKVDKPGMPEVLRAQNGKLILQSLAHTHDCLIETNNMDALKSDDDGASANPTGKALDALCHYTTTCGCMIRVCKGDLTKENVDAIVNAANVNLQHIGGLAKAIAVAGGDTIQQESDRIIKQRGKNLSTSEAVSTGAGQLSCRHVIHVAGPVWRRSTKKSNKTTHEENLLYDAITNSLKEAHILKCKSVALPAISAGIYGFPMDLCATTVVGATVDFIKNNQTTLREIRFTNNTVEHSMAFQKALKNVYGKDVVDGKPASVTKKDTRVLMDGMYTGPPAVHRRPMVSPRPTKAPVAKPPADVLAKTSSDTVTTKEGKKIVLKRGSIATEQADVLVNTTAGEMDLSRGNVSQALLLSAGPGLQQECDAQVVQADGTRTAVAGGDFIETGPANLKCKKVYHSHCPAYNQTNADQDLQKLVTKLLQQASKCGMTSIAIPAIGTGNLGFPRDITARAMYEAAIQFSKANPGSTVNDIRFWVYDKDQPTIQAFETEMQTRASPTTTPAVPAPTPVATSVVVDTPIPLEEGKRPRRKMKKSASAAFLSFSEPVPEPDEPDEPFTVVPDSASVGYSEIKIGSVTIQLQQGDLVKENADAIVNTVGKDLALKGVVSRALVKAGGKVIANECSQIRKASPSVPHIAKTSAGKLPSKHIIHVTLAGPDKVKKMAKEILQLAEKDGIQSIAFPALGTGNLGGTAQQVAPELIDAIGEFATTEKPKNVQLVKLVIFQQDMIPVFEETLKSKSGSTFKKPESAWTRGMKTIGGLLTFGSRGGAEATDGRKPANKDYTINPDSMTLYIVARDKRKLDDVVAAIEDYIKREFYSEEIIPEGVADLTAAVTNCIRAIAKKHEVKAGVMKGKEGVLLEGAKNAVLHAKSDIHAHFARIQSDERRIAEDRLISKEIQWRYKTSSGIYDDYDSEINAVIERAYKDKDKKSFIELDLEDEKIRIDFVKMVEIDVSGVKPDVGLNRADLKAEMVSDVPSNWIPMTATENLKIVPLTPGSKEYKHVETTFGSGYRPNAMITIARIQNKEIYKQYTARKDQMKARLGRDTERILYHGTSPDTVDKINMRGFNRSFSGKNAVAFGQGTYFARDVAYSAQSRYSPANASGHRFIYMCKVLVGDCERGNSSMIVPNPKPGSADIYDSTVDAVQNPSIVVIYHDAQAYPEYLITFY